MSAPGAEEFVPQSVGSFALPPTRTFAPLGMNANAPSSDASSLLNRERVRHVGVSLEREFATLLFQARHFRQEVDDQLVTIFGLADANGTRADLGHYAVGRAGSFVANGWGFGVSRMVSEDIRGSVEYRTARANWVNASEQVESLMIWAPSAVRPDSERLHDVTAKIESEIKPTSTRVVAAYRISTAYTRNDVERPDPGGSAPLRRADPPGPAVPRVHPRALGAAPGRAQSVPRAGRSHRVPLRRAPGRTPAQASPRRRHRPVLREL